MLTVLFGPTGHTLSTMTTSSTVVTVGSDRSCDIILGARLAPLHCRLIASNERWYVEPQAGCQAAINGVATTQPTFVDRDDVIELADYTLQLQPMAVRAEEASLLEQARADPLARLVYADWLEQHGQWDRAEYLRHGVTLATLSPDDPKFAATTNRLQALAPALPAEWRMAVASAVVATCMRRAFTCTMSWDRLTPSDDPAIRSCNVCARSVHYCATEAEAIAVSQAGHCTVIDPAAWRSGMSLADQLARLATRDQPLPAPPGMYLPPRVFASICPGCGKQTPSDLPRCYHCGRAR